jgi:hypothetical protein
MMTLNSTESMGVAATGECFQNAEERRAADRQMSVLFAAKIAGNGQENVCRVHNISVNGAKIETLALFQKEHLVRIEFRSDIVVDGIVRWVEQGMIGVEFSAPVDIAQILKRSDFNIMRTKPRAPRYKCNAKAAIEVGKVTFDCSVLDISLSGVKLSGAGRLRVGNEVFMDIEGLPKHGAIVEWCRGNDAGLKLVNAYRYHEIEWWLFWNGAPEAAV